MRCSNPDCTEGKDGTPKVHKYSQKGDCWKIFRLCPKCFKSMNFKFKIPILQTPMLVIAR